MPSFKYNENDPLKKYILLLNSTTEIILIQLIALNKNIVNFQSELSNSSGEFPLPTL